MQISVRDFARRFQPTLPARGATKSCTTTQNLSLISTHAPRTGSDAISGKPSKKYSEISTHAPRTGSDYSERDESLFDAISTHAPRTGSDGTSNAALSVSADFNPRSPHGERRTPHGEEGRKCHHFNPRSPHGERLYMCLYGRSLSAFQPTLPARGATI